MLMLAWVMRAYSLKNLKFIQNTAQSEESEWAVFYGTCFDPLYVLIGFMNNWWFCGSKK